MGTTMITSVPEGNSRFGAQHDWRTRTDMSGRAPDGYSFLAQAERSSSKTREWGLPRRHITCYIACISPLGVTGNLDLLLEADSRFACGVRHSRNGTGCIVSAPRASHVDVKELTKEGKCCGPGY